MSALMTDTISGAITPSVTNAVCNAGSKLLKMAELEQKYGRKPEAAQQPTLPLARERDVA